MSKFFNEQFFKNFEVVYKDFEDVFGNVTDAVKNYESSKIVNESDCYRIKIAVPGLTKDDIKITTKDGILRISHDRLSENKDSFVESFKKSYKIPDDTDERTIVGKVENGMVVVTLPKLEKRKSTERVIKVD